MVGEHRPARDHEQRLTLAEAAEVLSVSKDAVRMRVRRGTLRSEKGEDGRVYVFVHVDQDAVHSQPQPDTSREVVEVLQAQVEDLKARLDRETEANRENRRIIAALTSRIPEIEAPTTGSREGDLTAEDEGRSAATPSEGEQGQETARERPWWRRILGSG
jgi:excisionase family DNA binding protein